MIFSNDATALILTPVVYVLVTRLRLPVLPYMFACTFIADTASFLLPISNPINIIVLSRFPLDLFSFLRLLLLPSLVVIAINFAIFYLLYRSQLKGITFPRERLPTAEMAVKHKPYFRYTLWVLAIVAPSYVIASAFLFPLSMVAVAGALLLLAGALFWKRTTLAKGGQRNLLVYLRIHRRNVHRGSRHRRYRAHDEAGQTASASLRRYKIWRRHGGHVRGGAGDELNQ